MRTASALALLGAAAVLLAGMPAAEAKKTAKVTNVVFFDIEIDGEKVRGARVRARAACGGERGHT